MFNQGRDIMEKVNKIKAGDVRTASRLIRHLEDGMSEARSTIKHIFPLTGKAHVIGITGSPGAGKSTLVDGLVECFRKGERRWASLPWTPPAPFPGSHPEGPHPHASIESAGIEY